MSDKNTTSVDIAAEVVEASKASKAKAKAKPESSSTAIVVERPKTIAEMMQRARNRDWNSECVVTHKFGKNSQFYGTKFHKAPANAVANVCAAYSSDEERFSEIMDELSELGHFRCGEFLPGETRPTFSKRTSD